MARDQIAAHERTEPDGAKRRHSGNEPVDDRGAPGSRRAQEGAAHRRKIKPADLGEHIDHIVPVRPVHRNGGTDNRFLFPEAPLRDAAAAPRHLVNVRPQQHGKHRRRSRRVADAHLADTDSVRIDVFRDRRAGQDRLQGLLPRHRGAGADILRAVGNFTVQNSALAKIGIHADVAHGEAAAKALGEHRRAGLSPRQVDRLLHRHGLRRTGNALGHHAVVRGKDKQLFSGQLVVDFPRNARQLNGKLFEPPQAARRLGKPRLMRFRRQHRLLIQRLNGAHERFDLFLHCSLLKTRFPGARKHPCQTGARAFSFPSHSRPRPASAAAVLVPSARPQDLPVYGAKNQAAAPLQ